MVFKESNKWYLKHKWKCNKHIVNMDHCESFPIVGSSLITSMKMKEKNGYGRVYEWREGWEELGGVERDYLGRISYL